LVIEALEAHSDAQQRVLDRIAVIERCEDGSSFSPRNPRT